MKTRVSSRIVPMNGQDTNVVGQRWIFQDMCDYVRDMNFSLLREQGIQPAQEGTIMFQGLGPDLRSMDQILPFSTDRRAFRYFIKCTDRNPHDMPRTRRRCGPAGLGPMKMQPVQSPVRFSKQIDLINTIVHGQGLMIRWKTNARMMELNLIRRPVGR